MPDVSKPGDALELEADRVAEAVMGSLAAQFDEAIAGGTRNLRKIEQGHELALTGSGRPGLSGRRIATRTAAFRQASQPGDCPLPTQTSPSRFVGSSARSA